MDIALTKLKQHKEKGNIEDIYPLSDIEEGMIYHSVLDVSKQVYQYQMLIQWKEENFNIDVFKKSFQLMVEKHSIFRTLFLINKNERPVHVVLKSLPITIRFEDISQYSQDEKKSIINSAAQQESRQGFDLLEMGVLWRLTVFMLDSENIGMLWKCHHAITDGWSTAAFITELNNTYQKLKKDVDYIPIKLKCTYKDFIIQQELIKKDKAIHDFWREELEGFKRFNLLENHSIQSKKTEYFKQILPEKIIDELNSYSAISKIPQRNIFFSAFVLALNMFNYYDEIVVGNVANSRPVCEDGDKLLGCCINTIPVRIKAAHNYTWKDYVQYIHKKLIELKRYENLSLKQISKLMGEDVNEGNPFFNVLFNFTEFHIYSQIINDNEEIADGDYSEDNNGAVSNMALNFSVDFTGKHGYVKIRHSNTLEYTNLSNRLFEYFIRTLEQILNNSNTLYRKDKLFSVVENTELKDTLNPIIPDIKFDSVISRIEGDNSNLDKIAIHFSSHENNHNNCTSNSITYKYLFKQVDKVASFLYKNGIGKNHIVGLLFTPSTEMIISMLGILKSGAAFLPLSPDLPNNRKRYILDDSGVELVLTNIDLNDNELGRDTIRINDVLSFICDDRIVCTRSLDDIAYVIYTSGTTGKPKGVAVKNRNLINYINWFEQQFGISATDKTILTTSYAFDLGYTSIFPILACRGELNIVGKETYLNPNKLLEKINLRQITFLKLTPSLLSTLTKECLSEFKLAKNLKYILVGGEKVISSDLVNINKINNKINFINHYGPTEATIGCVFNLMNSNKLSDYSKKQVIGKPITNSRAVILDQNSQFIAHEAVGELCILGEGISQGYINRPDLTKQRFITGFDISNHTIYKTGDLARFNYNRDLEFIGRQDDQIKSKGYRIELKEIENVINKHPLVQECIVLIRKQNDIQEIFAFVITIEEFMEKDILLYISKLLPYYMMPKSIVHVNSFPLTQNGKLDKPKLFEKIKKCQSLEINKSYPKTGTEVELSKLWAMVLNVEISAVYQDSNFFSLGGDSVRVVQLMLSIKEQFNINVPFNSIFTYTSLKALAAYLDSFSEKSEEKIPRTEKKEYYPVSSAQKRLFLLDQIYASNTSYNMPAVFIAEGTICVEKFKSSLTRLLSAHEILRTSFHYINHEVVQKINESTELNFIYEDLSSDFVNEDEDQIIEKQTLGFIRPFNLKLSPLFRFKLLKLTTQKWVLLFDMHHIISDGSSRNIMISDLIKFYKNEPITPQVFTYKDFATWQNKLISSTRYQDQEKFWCDSFSKEFPTIEFPTDFSRPPIQDMIGANAQLNINATVSQKIYSFLKQQECTLYMFMLSIVNIIIYKFTGHKDIIVGSPVENRYQQAFKDTLGIFLNTIAIRNEFDEKNRFDLFLQEIKTNTINVFSNQDYQFETLIDKLNLKRDLSRNPLFDVFLNVRNFFFNIDQSYSDFEIKPFYSEFNNAKFALNFYVTENQNKDISINLVYAKSLFEKNTIQFLLDNLLNLIDQVLLDSSKCICDYNIFKPNKTSISYGAKEFEDNNRDDLVIKRFNEIVHQYPDKIAINKNDDNITFKELSKKSSLLASYIQNKKVTSKNIILLFDQSIDMIVTMIAILNTNHNYVPIDIYYPISRIQHNISDSGSCYIVSSLKNANLVNQISRERNDIEVFYIEDCYADKILNKTIEIKNCDKNGYILYTSGSTGVPKGIHQIQRNIYYFINTYVDSIKVTCNDRISLFSNYTHDASVIDIFSSLLKGATLYLYDIKNNGINRINAWLLRNEISIWHSVPTLFRSFIKTIDSPKTNSLRAVVLGGETVLKQDFQNYVLNFSKDCLFVNLFGMTELSISFLNILNRDSIINKNQVAIGKPVSNANVLILKSDNIEADIFEVGEICYKSNNLSLGYWNDPQLTDKSFIKCPYYGEDVLLKSGDLGYLKVNGEIEFVGRNTSRIKLNGNRIELNEIENVMLKQEGISEVGIINVMLNESHDSIVAFYVAHSNISNFKLRKLLRDELPDYMIPNYFIQLDEIPKTNSGKLIRQDLLEKVNLLNVNNKEEEPKTNIEIQILDFWKEKTGVKKISLNDNFIDIGGNSLQMIELIDMIEKLYNYKLRFRDIYTQNLKQISSLIEQYNNQA